jgi:hypothetical protein
MGMKRESMPFGRSIGYVPVHPDRTARSAGRSYDSLVTFQTWPNRASMAKSIRMQQSRAPMADDWNACVPLTDGEGF